MRNTSCLASVPRQCNPLCPVPGWYPAPHGTGAALQVLGGISLALKEEGEKRLDSVSRTVQCLIQQLKQRS